MKQIFHTMRPTKLHSPDLLVFLLLLKVYSSVILPAKLMEKMSRKRDTPGRGSIGRGGCHHKETLKDTGRYVMQVAMHVRCMIDDWESKVVSEHLASERNGGKINYYWIMKNMMVMLSEDMKTKWNGTRDMVQSMHTYLNQTNAQLSTL